MARRAGGAAVDAKGEIAEQIFPQDKNWYPKFLHHFNIPPFAPGGASDFVARIISPKLSELLGQPLQIGKGGLREGVILDLRSNGGGDNTTMGHFEDVLRDPAINRPGRLVAGLVGERVHKTEPGVVPGPCVLGPGIPQPDDEA